MEEFQALICSMASWPSWASEYFKDATASYPAAATIVATAMGVQYSKRNYSKLADFLWVVSFIIIIIHSETGGCINIYFDDAVSSPCSYVPLK